MAELIRAEAVVVAARAHRTGGQADDGDPYWWQSAGSAVLGKTGWDLVLDVPLPDGDLRWVEIRAWQPNRLFGVRGFLAGELSIGPGAVLPVLVDPADRSQVDVDWRALGSRPGAREQLQAARDARRSEQATAVAAATLRSKPRHFERNRQLVLESAQSIVEEIQAGRMQPDVLESHLQTNVDLGLISREEAAGFRAAAGSG